MIVPESVKKDWDVVSEPSLIQIDKLKKELQTTKEELQTEKKKTATMELLVASLLKRVGDLENLVI